MAGESFALSDSGGGASLDIEERRRRREDLAAFAAQERRACQERIAAYARTLGLDEGDSGATADEASGLSAGVPSKGSGGPWEGSRAGRMLSGGGGASGGGAAAASGAGGGGWGAGGLI